LMAAAGAAPAGVEGVPFRHAAAGGVFLLIVVIAAPTTRCVRLPFARRASDAREFIVLFDLKYTQ